MAELFEPVKIGAIELAKRIVMAPLTRIRADDQRVPEALTQEYYAQRASAGLIVTEATSVSPQGVGYPNTPGILSAEQTEGWARVTAAVHQAGGKIVCQLWHVGRISDPVYLDGELPVAPSAIAPEGFVSVIRPQKTYVTPRALDTDEIAGIVEDYLRAAENAKRSGFTGASAEAVVAAGATQTVHRQPGFGGAFA